ncbi:L-amino acid N-acyltransferase YncA [Deinococcus reticulitermitis]|uniref:L-amino acid N-acyltransferase YncA n=1 Tax=Deinococcus reticulitermitis TaxID=856736 RepID=A0A1H7AQA7_9DEIO|nr:GNAT family N-acetyltransferase [Deinococcus reticulitermitis]SEJ67739.1 L-amino acid N-acyltransferase YncA [Deinococcus reticulitermitis]
MIRLRTRRDGPALMALLRDFHRASGYALPWPADPDAFLTPPGTLAAWVAEGGGEVVGSVLLRELAEPMPKWAVTTGLGASELAVVSRLYVAPAVRRAGLGRRLLAAAQAEAGRLGRRAVADVHAEAAASVALYQAEGWWRVATVGADWQIGPGERTSIHVYLAPGEA